MVKKEDSEYYELNIIDDIEGGYFFHTQDRQYTHQDYEYDGYGELIYMDFIGYAEENNKNLKVDVNTKVTISINFSEYLGSDDRIGMVIKSKISNEVNISIGLPANSRQKFMYLQSIKSFKSITILAKRMKYNKAIVTSFSIRTTMLPQE